jgi:TolA-binding protein
MKAINNGELGIFNNDMQVIEADLRTYLGNHRNGLPGEAGIGQAKRDMLNGLIGTGTAVQRKANPLFSDLNPRGSVRSFRLDRYNDLTPTGREGLSFDYDKINNNRMPQQIPREAQGMPDAEVQDAPKDTYARSLEDIKAVIPPEQRFVGNKAPGRPVLAPDGRPYLQHDLSRPTGDLHLKQADIDSAWQQAIDQSGPAARRAVDELAKRGIVMRPPDEAHWRAVGNLPLMDRFWYETSAEAMVISFPGMAQRGQSPKVMDTVAATSPLADPNYNAKLAISFLSEDFREVPAQTPAPVPKGVSDALLGTFGREEQRKIGSFGGTFRFLAGLSDDPPLTTNDRQVASSFGVPDKVFGEFPVMYEAVSRFYNKLRDTINAGQADKSMGVFESHQLQALSWVQHRAELELARSKNVSVQEAFDGDAYAVAFRRAADELRAEGIAVASDPATGLPIFDDAVLSNPRVVEILAPTTKEFVKDTFQTMEIVTKLTKTGDEFSRLYEESKALGVRGNIKDAEAVISRGLTALMTRKDYVDPDYIKLAMQISPSTPYSIASGVLSQMESRASLRAEVGKKSTKATSILTDLARVFDPRAEETTRIEFALGTFQGDFNQHLRIPIGTVPEQYRPAYLAILGKPYAQAAQAASSFISTQPGQTPTSYSVFFRGRVDPDFLGQMAKDLSAAGHEANVSIRPNGIVVDVMPQFGNAGPVPINPTRLKQMADATAGDTTTASVIDRDFSSIYLERTDYAREINKGKKGLLNDTATEIQKITGSTRAAARDFASGTGPELSGNKAVNRRAEKARDRYRQRVRQLESVETRIRDMAKEFERDMAKTNKVMQQKLERQRKAKTKPAQPAPEGLDDL